MKLLRVGDPGRERPAILDQGGVLRDLSSVVSDIDAAAVSPEGIEMIAAANLTRLPPIEQSVRIGPCVARPGKFLCIGLNFADHAAETNAPIPQEPVIFMKATSSLSGPNDPIIQP